MDFDIRGLALKTARRLVDHDLTVGECKTHARLTGGQQKSPHARRPAHADRGDRRGDVAHGVVDGQTGRHRPAGGIDVQVDFLFRILGLQEKKLGADQRRHGVVDLRAQKHNTVLEQPGINIIGPLGAACGFNDHGN